MAGADDFVPALTNGPMTMTRLFDAGGAAVIRDGEIKLVGETPLPEAVLDVAEALRTRSDQRPSGSNRSSGWNFDPLRPAFGVASGALAVFFGRIVGTPCCGSGRR